jgi:hypothetical protein
MHREPPQSPLYLSASRPSESQLALCHALPWSNRPRPVCGGGISISIDRWLDCWAMRRWHSYFRWGILLRQISSGQPHASLRLHPKLAPSNIRRAHSLHGRDNAINLNQYSAAIPREARALHMHVKHRCRIGADDHQPSSRSLRA